MNTLIVIPARLESTRLPRKLLLDQTGMPLIQHTWQAACRSGLADDVLVATDAAEIEEVVTAFGGRALRTSPAHTTGTDRLAEVARQYPEYDVLVNLQGDEPEIGGGDIDQAIGLVRDRPAADLSTLACPLHNPQQIEDPACVKVVFDRQQRALYFSRSPIPWARAGLAATLPELPHAWHQHIGIYVYRRESLLEITASGPPPAEQAESLEQLRALHLGKTILVGLTERSTPGIDTAEDYAAFVSRNSS